MKYRDLIHFEPIDSVVQLTESNDSDYALHLLDTYVISDRMAEVLDELLIEQVQFNRPVDNKGILVVGNYGTGKSHLMSVVSTIAELEDAEKRIKNKRVAQKAKEISGRFKVIRTELGSVTASLRDIICQAIEEGLEEIGVDYSFPPANQIRNNKIAFMEMMGKFQEVYPDKGLLLVVDELLDYLRSRKEQELFLDLGFLREIGEICNRTRFRFIAGVQEMLFDNPKFQFVAEQLRRVRERFEQVRIVREDIAFVVSERLLKKDEKQKEYIRNHLRKFIKLYNRLGEEIEKYVNLFPIHPAYLATFEKVTVAEKRVILKTLSTEMYKIMDNDVPEEEPGLISFDSYWQYIENDPSLKSNPDIKEVMSKSKILQDRIQNAFTKRQYKPMAIRIVQALSVFRLTTDDIYTKVGMTPEELRDELFLIRPLSLLLDENDPADFLKTVVESVLREIQRTVSFQYISANETNGQYYLDIKKDIAVDDLISQKSEGLTNHILDRYYFEALKIATETVKTPYVSDYRIWLHELPWNERMVTRQGYLFFGAPNERSTAQPPRDFYIYFLQPFDVPKFKDEEKADEVFFKLVDKDEHFIKSLQLYAGAKELSTTANSSTKKLYEQKAEDYLKDVVKWLKANFYNAFEATYKGKKERVSGFGFFVPQQASLREIIDAVASNVLSTWFEERYPDYPSFRKLSTPLTKDNLETYVRDAFKYIAGTITRQGRAILDGFVLLDGENVSIVKSGYAKWVIDKLQSKGSKQVVNQTELIETVYTSQGTEDIRQTIEFSIEPELFTVVLAALVYNGHIVINIDGKNFDAMQFDQLIRLPLRDFVNFSHIKKPSGLPWPELHKLFDLFKIAKGLQQESTLKQCIEIMFPVINQYLEEVVKMQNELKSGFPIGESTLLSKSEVDYYRNELENLKSFLEGLLVYSTPAKFHNFKYSIHDIEDAVKQIELLNKLKNMQKRSLEITRIVSYITKGQDYLFANHEWQNKVEDILKNLSQALKRNKSYQNELYEVQKLKEEYKNVYITLHNQARLNAVEDNKKSKLLMDSRLKTLQLLSNIEILPKQQLDEWQKSFDQLKTCWYLTREELDQIPICPHCRYRPREEINIKRKSLEELENQLEEILNNWIKTLKTNLLHPDIQKNIMLLKPEQQEQIHDFVLKENITVIDNNFIQTVRELLQGLERVEITIDDLIEVMANGSPLTLEEVRERFEKMLRKCLGNQPSNKIRIMLKR